MFDRLLDLLLPGRCVSCEEPGELLCVSCGEQLLAAPRPVWPTPTPPGLPFPCAVADYDGPIRTVLREYKEQGLTALRDPLAVALAMAVGVVATSHSQARPCRLALLPMPSSGSAQRRRGDDPVARLSRLAARKLTEAGVETVMVPGLRQVRAVADSAGQTAVQRRANVAGSLALSPGALGQFRDRDVVLVDDVITTGSTLAAAAAVLRAAGVEPIGAATVAATRRRNKSDPLGVCPFAADRSTVPF